MQGNNSQRVSDFLMGGKENLWAGRGFRRPCLGRNRGGKSGGLPAICKKQGTRSASHTVAGKDPCREDHYLQGGEASRKGRGGGLSCRTLEGKEKNLRARNLHISEAPVVGLVRKRLSLFLGDRHAACGSSEMPSLRPHEETWGFSHQVYPAHEGFSPEGLTALKIEKRLEKDIKGGKGRPNLISEGDALVSEGRKG